MNEKREKGVFVCATSAIVSATVISAIFVNVCKAGERIEPMEEPQAVTQLHGPRLDGDRVAGDEKRIFIAGVEIRLGMSMPDIENRFDSPPFKIQEVQNAEGMYFLSEPNTAYPNPICILNFANGKITEIQKNWGNFDTPEATDFAGALFSFLEQARERGEPNPQIFLKEERTASNEIEIVYPDREFCIFNNFGNAKDVHAVNIMEVLR